MAAGAQAPFGPKLRCGAPRNFTLQQAPCGVIACELFYGAIRRAACGAEAAEEEDSHDAPACCCNEAKGGVRH